MGNVIEIPKDMLQNALRDVLKRANHPHADLVSTVLVNNLERSEQGLTQTFLALMGSKIHIPFLPGDEVQVPVEHMSSWMIDKDAMIQAGFIVNGHIKGTIKKIDPYVNANVHFTFERIYSGKQETYQSSIAHKHIFIDDTCKIRNDLGDKL
jgi:hypothetical protein